MRPAIDRSLERIRLQRSFHPRRRIDVPGREPWVRVRPLPGLGWPNWIGSLVASGVLLLLNEAAFGDGFSMLSTTSLGIDFENTLSESSSVRNRILENGSGVAAGDLDGDGDTDLYFCRLDGPNAAFENLGRWRFEPFEDLGSASCPGQYSTGAVLADLDDDGDLDLLVNGIGVGTRCFANNGTGGFEERRNAGLATTGGATSMALADVDLDGDLDLYVASYRSETVRDNPRSLPVTLEGGLWKLPPELETRFVSTRNIDGRPVLLEQGEPDRLYLNDGAGGWTAVDWTKGFFRDDSGEPLTGPPLDWSLAALFSDFNEDGLPDLYVCCDFITPDRLWVNVEGRGFRAATRSELTQTPWSSMTADAADIDGDAHLDLFVADMLSPELRVRHYQRANIHANTWTDWSFDRRPQYMRNMLFRNRGDGSFAEVAQALGVAATDWTWNAAFLDVDLDGDPDLLVSNGHPHDSQDSDATGAYMRQTVGIKDRLARNRLRHRLPPVHTPNRAFENLEGVSFVDRGSDWGFASTSFGQGMALADLDGDGDRDVVINCLNSKPEFYRNDAEGARLAIRLEGRSPNRNGVGTRLRLNGDGIRTQSAEARAGGRYLSDDDGWLTFAMPMGVDHWAMEIEWPNRTRSIVRDLVPGRLVLRQEETSVDVGEEGTNPESLFELASNGLNEPHRESPFDDDELQPLLSRQLSRQGPGLAWIDADGDGWEDLVVGTGRGGHLMHWRNLNGTGWRLEEVLGEPFPGETTAILPDPRMADSRTWLCGISSYEGPVSSPILLSKGSGWFPLIEDPLMEESAIGPICMADVDRDGDLDLFAGGQVMPGRYPRSADSWLFVNDAGEFSASSATRLKEIGLVRDAMFADLNDDGWPDLVLACEWGPIRALMNHRGELRDTTRKMQLIELTGWWNSVAAGDFDADGRLDLVAGNWGRNTPYQSFLRDDLRVYYGRTPTDRFVALEAVKADQEYYPVWDRGRLSTVFPGMEARFPTLREYGAAPLSAVLDDVDAAFRFKSASTLDSVLLLNRGERFEIVALPFAAQAAPVFGIAVADFDGDGFEDLYLNQNFYQTDLEMSPHDAGVGAILLGRGDGTWRELPVKESGLSVRGAGRGCAVADFDRDGRPDLAIARNGRSPQVYRNRSGRQGLRVRLEGAKQNPLAIGARVRRRSGRDWGPVREIQAGGGYWSFPGRAMVFPALESAVLEVRWPDGQRSEVPVASGTNERIIRYRDR